jgi:hypothetical protein
MQYFHTHKERFHELFNCYVYYVQNIISKRPIVLEIGVSELLPLYKRLISHISLVTIDRPTEWYGFDAEYCINIGKADRHYNIDLNKDRLSKDYANSPLGVFDYIVCAEVLEHLVVNPVDFLADLIGLLTPTGYLYLTTPNFFSHYNLQKIERRENPQYIYPRQGENWDAHHHYREYEMKELLHFIKEAGGEVVQYYYSDCWDDPRLVKTFLSRYPDQASNLVVITRPKSGT